MSSASRPPVSWLIVEPGWRVRAADGTDAGTVAEVLGAADDDIFHGLSLSTGAFSAPRFVDASLVDTIVEGEITLAIPGDAVEALPRERSG